MHACRPHADGQRQTVRYPLRVCEARLREHPEWSDRLIANKLGCSHHTATDVRKAMEAGGQIAQLPRLLDEDGKWRKNTRKPAAKPASGTKAEAGPDSGHPAVAHAWPWKRPTAQ